MEPLLSPAEAAQLIDFPEATLRYWRRSGTGPAFAKIGRKIVYRESDIRNWVDEQFAASREAAS